jgi:hypothetical protein
MENANTTNPASKTYEEARSEAHDILTADGFVFVEEAAEYRHADGRRGRMTFEPDMGSLHETRNAKGKKMLDTSHYRAVGLQAPGRKPTLEDMINRVPTCSAPVDVIRYW